MKITKFNDFTSITFYYINDLLWDDYENQILPPIITTNLE